ncbi:MOSC domain-containing protein [Barrientosiimonas endolithica]|uniref:MOSC domain-containing protein n=1 Tax=Barrientosiimonas endolithica TaxID=1535208 RepID=A0ABN6YUD4_9MICO|nr:hypothetical protein [Barrientosiimonas endolithica]BDZ59357.1 hypothetical protein GCM10025872_30140 [Barrientosiimonas endolithica]
MTGDTVRVNHLDESTWIVGDPGLDAHLSAGMGQTLSISTERFRTSPGHGLCVTGGTATLRWCANRWGVNADPRRLRDNLVIETDEPFIEESWMGQEAYPGFSHNDVQPTRAPRCRIIDIGQDGLMATGRWLKPLAAERDMYLAVYSDITVPGRVNFGDRISLIQPGAALAVNDQWCPVVLPRGSVGC